MKANATEGGALSSVFEQALSVAPEDVDLLGHASNVAYVRWIQDIARAHSEAVGLDFAAYRALGAVFVVRRHEVDYLRPAMPGEALRLRTWVESWKAASSVRRTEVLRADGTELARAATTWALVSTENGKPVRIGAAIREAFARS
jgi:acyl-CoA thioester hydrolase